MHFYLARAMRWQGRQHASPSENIKAISEPIELMAPIVSQAADLRAMDREYGRGASRHMPRTLKELQVTLDQVRFMMLARQAHLEASRSHLETLNLWATTVKQTR